MAFADPLAPTVGGVGLSLPLVSLMGTQSIYQSGDELFRLVAGHQPSGKARKRSLISLEQYAISADPFYPSQNVQLMQRVNIVVERPKVGFTATETKDLAVGAFGLLTADTNALLVKFIAGEH